MKSLQSIFLPRWRLILLIIKVYCYSSSVLTFIFFAFFPTFIFLGVDTFCFKFQTACVRHIALTTKQNERCKWKRTFVVGHHDADCRWEMIDISFLCLYNNRFPETCSTLEEVVKSIFSSCDDDDSGSVLTSKLITYITPFMSSNM